MFIVLSIGIKRIEGVFTFRVDGQEVKENTYYWLKRNKDGNYNLMERKESDNEKQT